MHARPLGIVPAKPVIVYVIEPLARKLCQPQLERSAARVMEVRKLYGMGIQFERMIQQARQML